jgi:hypothetical protein
MSLINFRLARDRLAMVQEVMNIQLKKTGAFLSLDKFLAGALFSFQLNARTFCSLSLSASWSRPTGM